MRRIHCGHRPDLETQILAHLQDNPNRWLTANEIAKGAGISMARTVGKRMRYLCATYPELEYCVEKRSGFSYYRYNQREDGTEKTREGE